jgi:N-acetylneuraminic acid mutarotase
VAYSRSAAWLCGALCCLAASREANAQTGSWQTLAPMPSARQEISTAVLSGKVYVIAGYDANAASTSTVQVYNPNTNTWAPAQPIPIPNNHNNAAVAAGRLYTFGGLSNRAFVYDPAGDSWTDVAPMNVAHGNTAAVGVFNDKIYVAGGTGGTQTELEVYDPVANTWTPLAAMSVPRNHTGGAFIDGKFYVAGGRGSPSAPAALEMYDPAANTWTPRAPMPTGRSGIGVAAVNGELYVFGGEEPVLHGEVEAYNPATNSWRSLPGMPTPRHGIWAAVIGDRVYLPGGGVVQGFGASNVNEMFRVAHPGVFANISSRIQVETGNNVLIGGMIVAGPVAKRIIVRALGPSVPVPGALQNPRLELYNGAGQLVSANDDWKTAVNRQEITDSSLAPSQDSEAAILTTVAPGNHTAVVNGVNSSTGVGLLEVYDLEAGSDSALANISTRGFVQTGNNVLIGGLILSGDTARKVIIRAIGPSLGRADALADPTLELRDVNGGLLAENNDWRSSQEAEIIATTIPPSHDLELAIVQTLAPSSFTAIVRGVNNGIGLGVVEAYSLE